MAQLMLLVFRIYLALEESNNLFIFLCILAIRILLMSMRIFSV